MAGATAAGVVAADAADAAAGTTTGTRMRAYASWTIFEKLDQKLWLKAPLLSLGNTPSQPLETGSDAAHRVLSVVLLTSRPAISTNVYM